MIISENRQPTIKQFEGLMSQTDKLLNADAQRREDYYIKRGGKPLESDVFQAICECSKGTPFEGTIQLVSGSAFPDIVANKYYGVEVKSTEKNQWKSIGSSILESTRIEDVDRIYLTFGKLGRPVQFKSRPYEECLSGIAVTHYPRYQIDMTLDNGETIFDKIGISYDELRKMDNPVVPVSKYYKSQLRPGESLWWISDNLDRGVPPTVRLWTALSPQQKEENVIMGYAFFPELFGSSTRKYNRYALWLATQRGIVNTNIRDGFSAGGRVPMRTANGVEILMPAVFGRVARYKEFIATAINTADDRLLAEYWQVKEVPQNRIKHWCNMVVDAASTNSQDRATVQGIMNSLFSPYFSYLYHLDNAYEETYVAEDIKDF